MEPWTGPTGQMGEFILDKGVYVAILFAVALLAYAYLNRTKPKEKDDKKEGDQ